MDTDKIYIVEGSAGTWDSHRTWLVCAFTAKQAAEDWRTQAQLHSDRAVSIDQYYELADLRFAARIGPEDPEGITAQRAAAEDAIREKLDREINPFDPLMQWHRIGSDDPQPQYRVVELPMDPVTP